MRALEAFLRVEPQTVDELRRLVARMETTGTGLPVGEIEAARALGMPVREPGERAITEEEVELSRNAKALLEAGLSPESFLELTAAMSSWQMIKRSR